MAFPRRNTDIDLEDGTASMRAVNLPMPDFRDIFNALGASPHPAAPVPSVVSFELHWRAKPGVKPVRLRDETNHFSGTFVDSTATIAWSARQATTNFSFVSASAASSTTVSGVIGHERNGKFFASAEDDD
jgi:hypothetical protein